MDRVSCARRCGEKLTLCVEASEKAKTSKKKRQVPISFPRVFLSAARYDYCTYSIALQNNTHHHKLLRLHFKQHVRAHDVLELIPVRPGKHAASFVHG